MNNDSHSAYQAIQRCILWGVAIVLFVTFGIGGWAATTDLAGAVVTQGYLVVDSNVKKVQHATGGTVGELRVREGDRVKTGDILLRLDETQTRAAVSIVVKNLEDLLARKARLEAERDNAGEIDFSALRAVFATATPNGAAGAQQPLELRSSVSEVSGDVARAIATERELFELRKQARDGQKSQLKERILQIREEIKGYTGQAAAKKREVELIRQELEGVRDLYRKNLVPLSRQTALERDTARLEGEYSQLVGVTAQARGKITETELQIIQVDQNLRSEVGKELTEIQTKVSELIERKVAAEDQLKRIDIRAPQDGKVHQLSVHTVGGVIAAGEQIMLIVPDSDALAVEVRVAPQDIDQLHLGQKAGLRFTAFNQRTTPEVEGKLSLISADLTQDQRTGVSYYSVRIGLDAAELARLEGLKLVPGMPVEAFIKTGERTMLSYLIKPLRDQAARAFKEK